MGLSVSFGKLGRCREARELPSPIKARHVDATRDAEFKMEAKAKHEGGCFSDEQAS
jgi:hypothetical protein